MERVSVYISYIVWRAATGSRRRDNRWVSQPSLITGHDRRSFRISLVLIFYCKQLLKHYYKYIELAGTHYRRLLLEEKGEFMRKPRLRKFGQSAFLSLDVE